MSSTASLLNIIPANLLPFGKRRHLGSEMGHFVLLFFGFFYCSAMCLCCCSPASCRAVLCDLVPWLKWERNTAIYYVSINGAGLENAAVKKITGWGPVQTIYERDDSSYRPASFSLVQYEMESSGWRWVLIQYWITFFGWAGHADISR